MGAEDLSSATRDLFDAIHKGNLAAVKESVDKGADLAAKDPLSGERPADLALETGRFEIAQHLLITGERQNQDVMWALPLETAGESDSKTGDYLGGWLLKWLDRKASVEIGEADAANASPHRDDEDIVVPVAATAAEPIAEGSVPLDRKLARNIDAYLGGWFFNWLGHRTGLIEGELPSDNFILPTGRATWPAESDEQTGGTGNQSDYAFVEVDLVPPPEDGTAASSPDDLAEDRGRPAEKNGGSTGTELVIGAPPLGSVADDAPVVAGPESMAPENEPVSDPSVAAAASLQVAENLPSDPFAVDAVAPGSTHPTIVEKLKIRPQPPKNDIEALGLGGALKIELDEPPEPAKAAVEPLRNEAVTDKVAADETGDGADLGLGEIPEPTDVERLADSVALDEVPELPKARKTTEVKNASSQTQTAKTGMTGGMEELGVLEDLPDMFSADAPKRSNKKRRVARLDALGAPLDVSSPAKPASRKTNRVPKANPKLPDNVLTFGESLHLGAQIPPPPDDPSERNHCIDKDGGDTVFCVEPVDWPEDMREQLRVSSIMYQGAQAVVRYDDGRATRSQAIFPNDSYTSLVSYYTKRFGEPAEVTGNTIAPFAEPRKENPTVQWQREDPLTDKLTTLEIRMYDDSRGGFPDLRHGTLMLYATDSPSIFPEVSALDLMPTSGSN